MAAGIMRAADRVAVWHDFPDPPPGAGWAARLAAVSKSKKFLQPANKLIGLLETHSSPKGSVAPAHSSAILQKFFDSPAGATWAKTYVKPQYADMVKEYLGDENYEKLLHHMPKEHHTALHTHVQKPAPNSNKFLSPANQLKTLLDNPKTTPDHVQKFLDTHQPFVKTYLHNPEYQHALKNHIGKDYDEWSDELGAPKTKAPDKSKAEKVTESFEKHMAPTGLKPMPKEKFFGEGGPAAPGLGPKESDAEDIEAIKKEMTPAQQMLHDQVHGPKPKPTGPHHNQYTDPSLLEKNKPEQSKAQTGPESPLHELHPEAYKAWSSQASPKMTEEEKKAEFAKMTPQGIQMWSPGGSHHEWTKQLQGEPEKSAPTGPHHNQYTDPSELVKNQPGEPKAEKAPQQYLPVDTVIDHASPEAKLYVEGPGFKDWYKGYQEEGGKPETVPVLVQKFKQYLYDQGFKVDVGGGDAEDIAAIKDLLKPVHAPEGGGAANPELVAEVKKLFPGSDIDWSQKSDADIQRQLQSWLKYFPEHKGYAKHVPKVQALYDKFFGGAKAPSAPELMDKEGLIKDITKAWGSASSSSLENKSPEQIKTWMQEFLAGQHSDQHKATMQQWYDKYFGGDGQTGPQDYDAKTVLAEYQKVFPHTKKAGQFDTPETAKKQIELGIKNMEKGVNTYTGDVQAAYANKLKTLQDIKAKWFGGGEETLPDEMTPQSLNDAVHKIFPKAMNLSGHTPEQILAKLHSWQKSTVPLGDADQLTALNKLIAHLDTQINGVPLPDWAGPSPTGGASPKPVASNPPFKWDEFSKEFKGIYPNSSWADKTVSDNSVGPMASGPNSPLEKLKANLQTSLNNPAWVDTPKTQQAKALFQKWFPQDYAGFMAGQGQKTTPAAVAPGKPVEPDIEAIKQIQEDLPPPEPVKPFKSQTPKAADIKQWMENKPLSEAGWKQFTTWWGNNKLTDAQEQGLYKAWHGKDATPEQANAWFAAMFDQHSEPSNADLSITDGHPPWASQSWAFGKNAETEWPVFQAWATKHLGLPKNATLKQKMAVWNGLSDAEKAGFAEEYFPKKAIDTAAVVGALKKAYPDSNWSDWSNMSQATLKKNVQNLAESDYAGAIPVFNKFFGGNIPVPEAKPQEKEKPPPATVKKLPPLPAGQVPQWAKNYWGSATGVTEYTNFSRWAKAIGKQGEVDAAKNDYYGPQDLKAKWNHLPRHLRDQLSVMPTLPFKDEAGFDAWVKGQPHLIDLVKKVVPGKPDHFWQGYPWYGTYDQNTDSYTTYQKQALESLIKETADPQTKQQLLQLHQQFFGIGKPTLAEHLKAIGAPPASLKTKSWDSYLQTHTPEQIGAVIKKQLKTEKDPNKWIQYVDAWYKYFGGPSGVAALNKSVGQKASGKALPPAKLKMLYHWKKELGGAASAGVEVPSADYDAGPYVKSQQANPDFTNKWPKYHGWTTPGGGLPAGYKVDPALLADHGQQGTYTVPPEESKLTGRYKNLTDRVKAMAPGVFSSKDKETLKSESFRHWFQHTPQTYQAVMQDTPGLALDDFDTFMAGGPTHSAVPEGKLPAQEKWFDVGGMGYWPKPGDKDVAGRPLPREETHNPPRPGGESIKFPQERDVQETLPLTPGEHFAPKYDPMPLYRIVPVNLDFDPASRKPDEVKTWSKKDQETWVQQQRWRLREIDRVLHGAPQRNVGDDLKAMKEWAKANHVSDEDTKELADHYFSTQPTLAHDAKWKYLQEFAKEHGKGEEDMYDLADKLGIVSPSAKVPGVEANYDHPDLGQLVLDYLENSRGITTGEIGLGKHWTRDIDKLYEGIAAAGSLHPTARNLPIVMQALWTGQGEGTGQGGAYKPLNPSEREQNLRPGSPVWIRRLQIRSPDMDWHDLMDYGPMSQWTTGRNETSATHKVFDKPSLAHDLDKLLGTKHDPEFWDTLRPGEQSAAEYRKLAQEYIDNNPSLKKDPQKAMKDKTLRALQKIFNRHFVGRPDLTLKPHTRHAMVHPVRLIHAVRARPGDLYHLAQIWGIPHPERYGMPYMAAAPAGDRRALIVVDPQNDFIDGSLPVPGGEETAHRLRELMTDPNNGYDHVVTTQDWHTDPGSHWSENPDYEESWPRHGEAGTHGAELHPAIKDLPVSERFYKGQHTPGYSGFEGTTQSGAGLHDWLKKNQVGHVDVAGLATDKCVYNTAKDALGHGYHTRVLHHYSSPVTPEGGRVALADLENRGAEIVHGPQKQAARLPSRQEIKEFADDVRGALFTQKQMVKEFGFGRPVEHTHLPPHPDRFSKPPDGGVATTVRKRAGILSMQERYR